MDPIITAALAARTMADVDVLEGMLGKAALTKYRFLGDQEANWSSISSPADATSVLFERPTNMFDAVIEREAEVRDRKDLPSPAAAASTFFGVPRDGLREMGQADRERVASECLIQVLDSDDSKRRPTFAFRDHGIGLAPGEMPETILSLQRSNKLRKPYTNGIFGKGGSSTDAFSDATIIVARKQPALLNGGEDRIGVAVVREAEAEDMGLPFLRYLVGDDKLPYSVPGSSHPDFEPGVYVAHINYQAGKMGVQNWTNEESIYAFAETILFAPTLPYLLEDARSGDANVRPAERGPSVLSGLGQRLEGLKAGDGTIRDRSGWQTVRVAGVGEVRLRWWLFDDLDKRRTRVAKGYVVVFTTNGQIHHAWDNARLQQLVEGRRRVGQRLFAQVDCDGIPPRKRAKVFDSFRAQVRRGPEGRALEEAIADALAEDPDLNDAETQLIKETLASTAQRVSAAFRKRLNQALRAKVPGLVLAAGIRPGSRPPKAKPPEDLYQEPTTMTGPAEVTLLLGGRATVFMEINAVDGFVPDLGQIDLEGVSPLPIFSPGDLRKGRLRVGLEATPALADGSTLQPEVVLSWVRKNGGLGRIGWPLKIQVVSKIEAKPAGKPKGTTQIPTKDTGDVALIWGGRSEYGDDVVGEFTELKADALADASPDYAHLKGVESPIPTIILNQDFGEWQGYLRGTARQASQAALDGRRERYALGVGVVVANLQQQEKKIQRRHEAWEARQNGNEQPPKPMTEDQMRRALAEAAHGVLTLMPDFDALLNDIEEPRED
jgi:hypothetical protein